VITSASEETAALMKTEAVIRMHPDLVDSYNQNRMKYLRRSKYSGIHSTAEFSVIA
jgi:hypothetical protein